MLDTFNSETRLAILASHPIQYQAPLFRQLAKSVSLRVYFAHQATPAEQARAGFGKAFEWDIDLTSGYRCNFLNNVSSHPSIHHFSGCDTPEIASTIGKGGFDALLVMGWYLKSFIQGLLAAKRAGIPVMVRGDSNLGASRSPFKRMAKELVYPLFLRCFDAALYVGQRSRAYYEHYRYPPKRMFRSPHCVDADWFSSRATSEARNKLRMHLGIPPDATVLLFAGKLVPFKRPIDLIVAAAECRARGRKVQVMIAGDGELREQIVHKAKELTVPLHLLGFCNQTEMPPAYAASDCLVLPSDGRETWGLVANEALACGRPIIVSDACGCSPDLTSDGVAGRCFAVTEVQALAQRIEEVIAVPPSPPAIETLSDSFGLEAGARGIIRALHAVATQPKP